METIKVILIIIYVPLFLIGLFGNLCVLIALYKEVHLRSPFHIYLSNVALSDLLFMTSCIFQVVEYLMGEWFLGDVFCRIQAAFLEIAYTVSVLTLCVVAIERYISICRVNLSRNVITSKSVRCTFFIWVVSVIICLPQVYGRTVSLNGKGFLTCRSSYWSDEVKLIYYSILTVMLYLIPLAIMITAHYSIFKFLRNKVQISVDLYRQSALQNETSANTKRFRSKTLLRQRQRNRKVIKMLFVVTLVFVLLWSPFVFIRILRFSNVSIKSIIWKISQFLIMIQGVVNFFIYAFMSRELRKVFKSFIPCTRSQ